MAIYTPEKLLKILQDKINEAIDKLPELPIESADYTTCLSNLSLSVSMYASFIPKDKTEKGDKKNGTTN